MKKKEDVIRGQFPDPDKIKCATCRFRDKTVINLGGKVKKVGVTKVQCEKYKGMPGGQDKPYDILFRNASCKYYEKG